MNLKKAVWMLTVSLAVLSMVGCAGVGGSSKGILISTYKPSENSLGLKGEDCSEISEVYFSSAENSGIFAEGLYLTRSDKVKIEEIVKSVFTENNRIRISDVGGDYLPSLKIIVTKFDVSPIKIENGMARKEAVVALSMDLGDGCHTSSPVVETAVNQVRANNRHILKSDEELKLDAIRSVIKELVGDIIPQRTKVFRGLKEGDESISRAASLIQGKDCMKAFELLQSRRGNFKAMYNAGVACECAANQADSQEKAIVRLKKALEFYERALMLDHDDPEAKYAYQQTRATLQMYENTMQAVADRSMR